MSSPATVRHLSESAVDSEVGLMIQMATDSNLSHPDWTLIMAICDMCRASSENCEKVCTACTWRLKEVHENIMLLTLILIEACLKYCENTFPAAVSKPLMDEIVYIAIAANKGERAEETAQRMIKAWGLKHKDHPHPNANKYPIFYETYCTLITKGVDFPPPGPTVASPRPSSMAAPGSRSPLRRFSFRKKTNSDSTYVRGSSFSSNATSKDNTPTSAGAGNGNGSFGDSAARGGGNPNLMHVRFASPALSPVIGGGIMEGASDFENIGADDVAMLWRNNSSLLLKLEADLDAVTDKLQLSESLRTSIFESMAQAAGSSGSNSNSSNSNTISSSSSGDEYGDRRSHSSGGEVAVTADASTALSSSLAAAAVDQDSEVLSDVVAFLYGCRDRLLEVIDIGTVDLSRVGWGDEGGLVSSLAMAEEGGFKGTLQLPGQQHSHSKAVGSTPSPQAPTASLLSSTVAASSISTAQVNSPVPTPESMRGGFNCSSPDDNASNQGGSSSSHQGAGNRNINGLNSLGRKVRRRFRPTTSMLPETLLAKCLRVFDLLQKELDLYDEIAIFDTEGCELDPARMSHFDRASPAIGSLRIDSCSPGIANVDTFGTGTRSGGDSSSSGSASGSSSTGNSSSKLSGDNSSHGQSSDKQSAQLSHGRSSAVSILSEEIARMQAESSLLPEGDGDSKSHVQKSVSTAVPNTSPSRMNRSVTDPGHGTSSTSPADFDVNSHNRQVPLEGGLTQLKKSAASNALLLAPTPTRNPTKNSSLLQQQSDLQGSSSTAGVPIISNSACSNRDYDFFVSTSYTSDGGGAEAGSWGMGGSYGGGSGGKVGSSGSDYGVGVSFGSSSEGSGGLMFQQNHQPPLPPPLEIPVSSGSGAIGQALGGDGTVFGSPAHGNIGCVGEAGASVLSSTAGRRSRNGSLGSSGHSSGKPPLPPSS